MATTHEYSNVSRDDPMDHIEIEKNMSKASRDASDIERKGEAELGPTLDVGESSWLNPQEWDSTTTHQPRTSPPQWKEVKSKRTQKNEYYQSLRRNISEETQKCNNTQKHPEMKNNPKTMTNENKNDTIQEKRKPRRNPINWENNCLAESERYDQFITLKPSQGGGTFDQVCPLKTQREFIAKCGHVEKFDMHVEGKNLIVKTNNKEQSNRVKNLRELGGIEIDSNEPHLLFNTVRGVIYSHLLKEKDESVILDGLKDEGVVEVRKLMRNGFPSHIIFLTFDKKVLPQRIGFGWQCIKVEKYIRKPRRCQNCQRYGHGRLTCRSPDCTCGKCGESHDTRSCYSKKMWCVYCRNGEHQTISQECPQYKIEKEVIRLVDEEKMNPTVARITTRGERRAAGPRSYAMVAKGGYDDNSGKIDGPPSKNKESRQAIELGDNVIYAGYNRIQYTKRSAPNSPTDTDSDQTPTKNSRLSTKKAPKIQRSKNSPNRFLSHSELRDLSHDDRMQTGTTFSSKDRQNETISPANSNQLGYVKNINKRRDELTVEIHAPPETQKEMHTVSSTQEKPVEMIKDTKSRSRSSSRKRPTVKCIKGKEENDEVNVTRLPSGTLVATNRRQRRKSIGDPLQEDMNTTSGFWSTKRNENIIDQSKNTNPSQTIDKEKTFTLN